MLEPALSTAPADGGRYKSLQHQDPATISHRDDGGHEPGDNALADPSRTATSVPCGAKPHTPSTEVVARLAPICKRSLADESRALQPIARRLNEIIVRFNLDLPDKHSPAQSPCALRGRLNLALGAVRAKRRSRLRDGVFDPATARFWSSLRYPDFLMELGISLHSCSEISFDREAWAAQFRDALEDSVTNFDGLDAAELNVCKTGSAFGLRLSELRTAHADWPFVVGNLNLAGWLRALSDDDDPQAAEVYFSLSRGFTLLPPELATSFKATCTKNYTSALEHPEAVDAEIFRLKQLGFIDEFETVRDTLGLDPNTEPNILAIGAVVKKNKTRIVYDASMPRGSSVNDHIEPADTVLPSIAMAMAAMTTGGKMWKSDFTDAFLQTVLHASSIRLCCIEWRGQLYAYTRLGFGFKSGPTHQQSMTISVVRALSRRLRKAGLLCAAPPSVAHKYEHIQAKPAGAQFVNGILAFLDDVGGFSSALGPAWFSFSHYLCICRELSLAVSFKPGKTEPPADVMIYLGIQCDCKRGLIALDEDRLADLRTKLTAITVNTSLTVREVQSIIGVLVFCSVVIRLGRLHYHALIDAVTELGPNPRPTTRISVSPAIKANIEMWQRLLSLLNVRSARARTLSPVVPSECASDASLAGYGWCGMGHFVYGRWPSDWDGRLGPELSTDPAIAEAARRIYICECEIFAVLFMVRSLAPRCSNCILRIRVDNDPVVSMINRFSTRSKACLPILQEICWWCAVYAVELDCTWIDTKSNVFPDLLSRRYSPDFDQEEWDRIFQAHAPSDAVRQRWDRDWPVQPPVRPELVPHVPTARLEDFSSAWAQMSAEDLADILPLYLPKQHAS